MLDIAWLRAAICWQHYPLSILSIWESEETWRWKSVRHNFDFDGHTDCEENIDIYTFYSEARSVHYWLFTWWSRRPSHRPWPGPWGRGSPSGRSPGPPRPPPGCPQLSAAPARSEDPEPRYIIAASKYPLQLEYFGSHNLIPSNIDEWGLGSWWRNIEEECQYPLTIHSLQWQRHEGSCDVRTVLVWLFPASSWRWFCLGNLFGVRRN